MATQLKLTGNRYNIALTIFFVPYCLLECPANLVLKRFRPSRWLPGIATLWGIVIMSMGFVKTYEQLVGVRVCLGVAEAGLFPGIAYYLTFWYPRDRLQYRVGLFFGAASVSGAFSGLLGYGISFMNHTDGLLGWSWIFILEGCATIAVGILAFFVMVDFPSTAKFLTPEERNYAIWSKKHEVTSVGEEEHFEVRHIIMALTDWQVWLHSLFCWSVVIPIYGIAFFLPTIIEGFGHSAAVSNLLTVPPYAVATILLLVFAHYSDKKKLRWPFILAGLLISSVGFSINLASVPAGVKYFGTFLCASGSYAALPGIVAWYSGNIAGQYKRAFALGWLVGSASVAGIVASNIYRTQDAPLYKFGHGIELGFLIMGIALLPLMVFVYKRANRGKEVIVREAEASGGLSLRYTDEELRRMGDKAPNFPYGI